MTCFSEVLNRDGEFTSSEVVQDRTSDYLIEQNPVAEFVIEHPDIQVLTRDFHYTYVQWCINNNIKYLCPEMFGKKLKSLGYTKKSIQANGKRAAYYLSPDYKEGEYYSPNVSLEQLGNFIGYCNNCGKGLHTNNNSIEFDNLGLNLEA